MVTTSTTIILIAPVLSNSTVAKTTIISLRYNMALALVVASSITDLNVSASTEHVADISMVAVMMVAPSVASDNVILPSVAWSAVAPVTECITSMASGTRCGAGLLGVRRRALFYHSSNARRRACVGHWRTWHKYDIALTAMCANGCCRVTELAVSACVWHTAVCVYTHTTRDGKFTLGNNRHQQKKSHRIYLQEADAVAGATTS
jgi:hypothetical protein